MRVVLSKVLCQTCISYGLESRKGRMLRGLFALAMAKPPEWKIAQISRLSVSWLRGLIWERWWAKMPSGL
jgi:hypothetical protein